MRAEQTPAVIAQTDAIDPKTTCRFANPHAKEAVRLPLIAWHVYRGKRLRRLDD